jgi:PEP-CTERM motif-containing protein
MMKSSVMFGRLLAVVVMFGVASGAHAGLMISGPIAGDPSVNGFQKFEPEPVDGLLRSHDLGGGQGEIKFWYGNSQTDTGNALVEINDGDNVWGGTNWWNPNTYSIFTTGAPSRSNHIWIDLTGVNAYGFSFQLGANMGALGWFDVHYNDGQNNVISRENISISPSVSPGFQISNSGSSCQTIDKIHVDPNMFVWGVFNMGIDTTGSNCASVPEPGSLALLSLGLLGLGLIRFNQKRLTKSRVTRA